MADAAALDGERSEVTVDERSVFFWQYQFCSRNSLVFGELCLLEGLFQQIGHRYEGSILSSLTDARLPFEGRQVRGILSSLRSLDGLHCQEMCGSFRNEAEDAIGAAGEEIVAYLSTRHEDEIKGTLVPPLKQFFPSLVDVRLKKKRCGRAELWIKERFGGQTIEVKALHCSDGLLRLLGIVTALNTSADVLCFDEIGNSISVDVCSPLVDTLMQS